MLPGFGPFSRLEFKRRCPTGLRGIPPHLDVLLQGSQKFVGIESKLTEPLAKHRASFGSAYRENIRDERRESAWFTEMLRLEQEPEPYHRLDEEFSSFMKRFKCLRTFSLLAVVRTPGPRMNENSPCE